MDDYRQRAVASRFQTVLLRTDDAFEDTVDCFQVGGVGRQIHGNGFPAGCRVASLGAEVVFHVTRALNAGSVLGSLKLAENLAVSFSGNVGQDVQATAVCHPHGDLIEASFGGFLQDFVNQGDGRLATFEAEAFLADVFGLQEGFEGFRLVQFAQHSKLGVVGGLLVGHFEPLLEPLALLGFLDVHVFDTDGAAVGVAQHPQHLAKKHRAATTETTGDKLAVQIPERQAVALDFQVGVGALAILQRVNVGHQVTAHPERVDQFLNPRGLVDGVCRVHGDVFSPVDWHVGDAKRGKNVFVEAAAANEKLVDAFEELS